MDDLTRRLEAIVFIAPRPVSAADLVAACACDDVSLSAALEELQREYGQGRHGAELIEVAGGYAFRVARDCEEVVERFVGARRNDDLSPALTETLTIVAYLQPTTRAEVAQVRGVSSEWALASLVERGLVEECGRAGSPGAPILYGTTERFLQLFGLRSVDELPHLSEFALSAADSEEIRSRLLANAERRRL